MPELLRWRWAADVDAPSQDELLGAWAVAVTAFETFGAPFELAEVRARYGLLLVAVGDADAGRRHLEAAAETARALGALLSLR